MTESTVVDPYALRSIPARASSPATVSFMQDAEAPSTRRAYASDVRHFSAWCATNGLQPLPASPGTIADYLSASALDGVAAATLGRRVAAIAYAHRLASLPSPTRAEEVSMTLKGIRRRLGARPRRKAPATADLVLAMLATCDRSLTGLRDRALICMGFAGAFRRSELVALRVEDIDVGDDGLRVLIRESKTDKQRQGQTIAIPAGLQLRPGDALMTWLCAARISEGPLFRRVRVGGRVGETALSDYSVAEIVKNRALRAGLDPRMFSGHSLRAGFLTSAARAGASVFKMRDVSRHRSLETMNGYVRDAELFKDHAGASFL